MNSENLIWLRCHKILKEYKECAVNSQNYLLFADLRDIEKKLFSNEPDEIWEQSHIDLLDRILIAMSLRHNINWLPRDLKIKNITG